MIPNHTAQNIIETARIEEVVGDFVTLKRRGANLIANCPFHNEKTPSFYVSPAKGIYKCFGCGAAGNAVKFVMEHENLGYPDALRYLAKKYNIAIDEAPITPQAKDELQFNESLMIANQFAAEFYKSNLFGSDEGRSVGLGYFKERGFLESTLQLFGLGYALDSSSALLEAARKKGYSMEVMRKLGLIIDRNGRDIDFFRARVMFPIHNASGKVIAFAGRTLLKDKKVPKYVNSPETPIYHKSNHLFGLHLARNAVRRTDECILVEGYADVISLVQAGIDNVVASSGTSLTVEQAQLIKRYASNVLMLYDGDAAGIKAAMRGTDILIEAGLQVRIVVLPDNEDPDTYLLKVGVTAFKAYLAEKSQDFVLFKANFQQKEANNDPIRKAVLIKEIIQTLAKVDDAVRRSLYVREVSKIMDISEHIVVQEVNKVKLQANKQAKEANKQGEGANAGGEGANAGGEGANDMRKGVGEGENLQNIGTREALSISKTQQRELIERDLVRVLLEYGNKDYLDDIPLALYIISELDKLPLEVPAYANIVLLFRQQLEAGVMPQSAWFVHHSDEAVSILTADLLSTPYELSPNWEKMHNIFVADSAVRFKEEVAELLNRYKLYQVMKMLEQVSEEMKEAEKNKDGDRITELLGRYVDLSQKKANLTKALRIDIVR